MFLLLGTVVMFTDAKVHKSSLMGSVSFGLLGLRGPGDPDEFSDRFDPAAGYLTRAVPALEVGIG